MYDHILVPTDGSPETDQVIDHAVALAEIHDAVLHAIYVVNTASYAGLPSDPSIEGLGQVLGNEGEAALDHVEERAAGTRVERVLSEGSPSREITEYATAEDCDLIVMGTHGRGGIDRLLLGSVAERVVRTADVPVLTVRVTRGEAAAGEDAEGERTEPAETDAVSNARMGEDASTDPGASAPPESDADSRRDDETTR